MWEGSRCPCKCGRGPSFSYPSNIPFSYRQLNRSYNKFDKIKIVHFCFIISSSTFLRDTYLRNILSFHPKYPLQRDIQTLHTEMRSIKTVPARSTPRGDSVPRSKPLPFYIPFWQKHQPFRIPSIDNGTHFTCIVYNFVSLLTSINVLPFKYEKITKPENVLDFFTIIKYFCSNFRSY